MQQAKQRYGVSSSRPQEKDPALRRELMSRNLGNVAAQDTDEYFKSLDIFSSVIIQRGPFTEAAGADVTMKQEHILLIDTPDALEIAMQEIACHPVIGVDFEFHIEDSYDGKYTKLIETYMYV